MYMASMVSYGHYPSMKLLSGNVWWYDDDDDDDYDTFLTKLLNVSKNYVKLKILLYYVESVL